MAEACRELWLLDAHCDSIDRRFFHGAALDLSPIEGYYHVTIPRMRAGNVGCLWTMVGMNDLIASLRMIDAVHQACAQNPGDLALCLSGDDVSGAAEAGHVAMVLTIEGQCMFGGHVELLRDWYRLGVRVCSLTHGEGTDETENALQVSRSHVGYLSPAERARLQTKQQGLTDFARESLKEMGRLGMLCDLAHVNDVTFWQALETAPGMVCVTHGNCAALCPHTRNITDEMMKGLAERSGVMGLCFYGPFVHEHTPNMDAFVAHVLHALEIMGEGGVGIGTDFDGVPEGCVMIVEEPSQMDSLWEALDKRGVPGDTLVGIAHGNFLRLLTLAEEG